MLHRNMAGLERGPEERRKVEGQLSVNAEMKEVRWQITVSHRELNNLVGHISEKDRTMLGFLMDHCRTEEDLRLQQSEVDWLERDERDEDGLGMCSTRSSSPRAVSHAANSDREPPWKKRLVC
jgi:hypothetical protein